MLPRNLNLKLSTNKPGLCARSFQRSVIYYGRCSCDRAWRLCRRYAANVKMLAGSDAELKAVDFADGMDVEVFEKQLAEAIDS